MDDPDWMNDFKTPMENVLLLSSSPSSSPSREVFRKKDDFYGTGQELSQSNGKEESDDDDTLISVLRESRAAKKGRKACVSGDSSGTRKNPPINLGAKIVTKGAVGAQEDDDDERESPKMSYIRRPLGKNKRPLELEEESDNEDYQIPSKVRKTASSPQVKKKGTARAPNSGRKSRKVSFSKRKELHGRKEPRGRTR